MACSVLKFTLHMFIKYMNHFYDQNILGLFLNVGLDLSFNSRTRQERNVNSHPPDGVDLCRTYILVSLVLW